MNESRSPTVIVFGGPNGAGKSTLAEHVLASAGVEHFVNADTIARGLSRFAPEAVAVEAGRMMIDRIRRLASHRATFAFEATLAGRGHARFLKDLGRSGYRVELVAVWLRGPELAVQRVARRVAGGGHKIPESDIERRFWRSTHNLVTLYMPLANWWRVYDNSLADPYTLVAEGQRSRTVRVHQPGIYDEFNKAAQRGGRV